MAKLRMPVVLKQGVFPRVSRRKNKQTTPTSAFKGLTSSQLRKLQKGN